MIVFDSFNPSSRVWIYQCNRILTLAEVAEINNKAIVFTNQWTAHQQLLKATFEIRYNLFLIFCVDEQSALASGCSIDKSLHLVQQLEKDFDIRLLDRMMAAYRDGDVAVPFNLRDFQSLYTKSVLTEETIVYNNLVTSIAELNTKWMTPLKHSWMAQLLAPVTSK